MGQTGNHQNTLRAGEMIPEVEGTRPWGPSRKRSPSVSNGPKPPIQILQLLKNSPRERKRAHFRYILGPPGSTQEMELLGPGGEGPFRSTPVSPAMNTLTSLLIFRLQNHAWLLLMVPYK